MAGPVYTAPFSAVELTTNPHDLWVVRAPDNSRVSLREIRLGQYTEFGDSQAELLSLQIMIGTTSTGAGTAITPRNVKQHTGSPVAGSVVNGPSSTVSSTSTAIVMLADAWNVAAGWWMSPDECERIVFEAGQTLFLRMSAPNDTLTVNGSITFEEIGKPRL